MNEEIKKYISQFDQEQQNKLLEVYNVIKNNIPKETVEKISWGMPTFYLKENLIHFALGKNHIGIYPGPEAVVYFEPRIEKYKHSKGAIQFKLSEDIPVELLQDIVKFRVKRITE